MTVHDEYGLPQSGDVVSMDGHNYIVNGYSLRESGEWVLVSAGRTDSGIWVARDRCTIVYRDSIDREKDDA